MTPAKTCTIFGDIFYASLAILTSELYFTLIPQHYYKYNFLST